jgi:uncharacterized protein
VDPADLIKKFIDDPDGPNLGKFLTARCADLGRKPPRQGEVGSWAASLPVLATQLKDAGLGGLTMFIEMSMPPWDEQADVVLAGPDAKTGRPAYAIVELKQWTQGEVTPRGKVRFEYTRGVATEKPDHPWEQVEKYGNYLAELYTVLDRDHCKTAVLLHNATDVFMSKLRAAPAGPDSTMYGATELEDFQRFMKDTFGPGSSTRASNWLSQDRLRQPDSLLKRMEAEFDDSAKGRFVLLGEQAKAYDLVSEATDYALRTKRPAAVIVHGKPGTGKTAVALSLAGESFQKKRGVYYWVWHVAFRKALRQNSGLQVKHAERLFRSPREHRIRADEMENSAALSICDEAHRLEKRTNNRKFKVTTDQIDDLLWTSGVHVFFVDDDQQMKVSEIGTVAQLQKDLDERNIMHRTIELTTQVRSGGVSDYVDWVRRVVVLDPDSPKIWAQREDFKLWIAERPEEVEEILKAQAKSGEKYRITAGICWAPGDDDGYGHVKIGDWVRPWNYDGANSDGPDSEEWGWKPGGHRQIGCVHTAQGLEWDWAGVIIGEDLVYRGDQLVPQLEQNTGLHNYKRDREKRERAEKLIRNAYYVLMTRGKNGMVIYAQDNLLRAKLRSLVQPRALPPGAEAKDKWVRVQKRLPADLFDVVYQAREAGTASPHVSLDYVPSHRASLAWRDQLVAVLDDDLSAEAVRAYSDAGWDARRLSEWTPDALQTALDRKRS